ncbi:MAG: efflux RND transporter periplasmic adaptor subunit [Gemmatimonadota bacterium]
MTARYRILLTVTAASALFGGCTPSAPQAAEVDTGMASMPGMATDRDSGIVLDPAAAARVGITFARADTHAVRTDIEMAGTVVWAEPRRQYVSARVRGWVEHLDADYLGKAVRKGDPLLSLYAPELVTAQEELLAARRLGDSSLVAASRRRLALWDIPEDQIAQLERTGQVRRALVLRAPRTGEIAEKLVTDGQAVQPGDNLFLIADREVLWVEAAVFEMDAALVRVGMPVRVQIAGLPAEDFAGRVAFVEPSLDRQSRTLTARIEFRNHAGRVRPGMYARVLAGHTAKSALTVPLTAVLPTGRRNLVFARQADGTFAPRDVVLGARGDSLIEIRSGLSVGDVVVASSTYLLDSESNLAAAMQGLMLRMGMGLDMGGMAAPAGSAPAPDSAMPGMKMATPKGAKP